LVLVLIGWTFPVANVARAATPFDNIAAEFSVSPCLSSSC